MATYKEQNKLNVPHLRFPEFHGEWEKCKLGDIATLTKGSGISKDQRSATGTPCILYGELYTTYKSEVINYVVSKTDISDKNLVRSCANDIIIPSSGETAIDISTARCVLSPDVLLGGDLNIIRLKDGDGRFFSYQLNGVRKHDIAKIAQGVSVVHLYGESIKGLTVSFPSNKEQQKISTLLSLIDERIATQSKLIEDLKKLKSAIIENVFDDKHSERLQLDNVGSYIRGLTYSSNDVVEHGGTLVMRSNNIVNGSLLDYNNNVVFVNKQMSAEQQLQNGDIVICMANGSSSLVGKSSFYDGNWHSPITVGAFCGIYRSKEPIVKWLFQTNKYRRYIWNSLQGGNGAIANLNGEDILNMSFSIPNAPIKDTCVKMLTSVDSALENNMSLCALYTLQKQHLLRQMFI